MGLSINKAIYYLLSNNEAVTGIVGSNMFPIVANEDSETPFLVYKRENISPQYTKDGLLGDEIPISVLAVTGDYDEGLNLIEKVREALELKRGSIAGIDVKSIRVTGSQEMFGVDEYGQKLNLTVKTSKVVYSEIVEL